MDEAHFEPIPFGRYQLVERIAIGGMAEIFKAKTFGAHGFEKTLAVKRILPQLAADPEFVEMFINEARLMVRLTHPKVVQVLDFGQVNGQYFIAMEYVNGIDALALLRICARHRCRPTTGIAVHIAADVLDALDYAHGLRDEQGRPLGLVHRDISPSNIFVSELGEVKLGDFGIARTPSRRLQTETGALKGKYGYMSPEIVNGAAVDHRSDIFSVGVVLAELLMVRRLFIAKSELEVLLQVRDARLDRLNKYGRHIQPQLRRVLEAALARDPDLRYQDAASFRDALHHFLFEQKRMIRPIEVRSFLQRLRDLDPQGETPTLKRVSSAAAPVPVAPLPLSSPAGGPSDRAQLEQAAVAARRKAQVGRDERDTERETEYSAHTRERTRVPRRQAASTAPASTSPASTSAPTDEDGGAARFGTQPGADIFAADQSSAEELGEPPAIGHRRKIPIGPPPRPTPTAGLAEPGDMQRLDAEDMLTALSELEASGSSSRDFKSGDSSSGRSILSFPSFTPTEPLHAAAVQLTSSGTLLPLPNVNGELAQRSLAKLLFGLATAEETGLLLLQRDELTKEIYLVDGDPHYITSNLTEELFGQYLVSRGAVSEGELSMVLAILPHFKGKLGNALVALKLMKPVQVLRHLTHQVRMKLLKAFAWDDGKFAYYHGRTCSLEAAPLGLDAYEIIGAGLSALPEESLMRRLEPILDTSPRSVSPPPVPPELFRLGGGPRQLFDQLDGRHTLRELLSRFDDPEQRREFGRTVYLFLETGLAISG